MVTPAQAKANVASATRYLAEQLGFYVNDGSGFKYENLTPQRQITLTNALAEYIRTHPASFDTGAADLTNPVNSAPLAVNQQISDTSISLDEFIDAAAASGDSVLTTIGNRIFIGLLVLGVVYVVVNSDRFKLPRPAAA